MNTEEKQLLLIDLCARLPYGVMIKDTYSGHYGRLVEIGNRFAYFISKLNSNTLDAQLYYAKPYLRPMSSMTEEEKEEYDKTFDWDYSVQGTPFDWLNKHHFDYRGLIEKGLALEAKEGMYEG